MKGVNLKTEQIIKKKKKGNITYFWKIYEKRQHL